MTDEVEELSRVLLNPVSGDKRKEACQSLSSHLLDIRAFNALYSISCYPDMQAVEMGLVPMAGLALGQILSKRDLMEDPLKHHELDPKYFDDFHPEALEVALSQLTIAQNTKVYVYTLKQPLASQVLVQHYYRVACEKALSLEASDPLKAEEEANNAIKLFKRFKKQERSLYPFFLDVVMHMITGETDVTIIPLFYEMMKKYKKLIQPKTEFERYAHFHIILITKIACRDFSHIQTLLTRLRDWMEKNLPEDMKYIQVLELAVRGDFSLAYKLLEEIRQIQKTKKVDKNTQDFYHSWYLAVRWIVAKM